MNEINETAESEPRKLVPGNCRQQIINVIDSRASIELVVPGPRRSEEARVPPNGEDCSDLESDSRCLEGPPDALKDAGESREADFRDPPSDSSAEARHVGAPPAVVVADMTEDGFVAEHPETARGPVEFGDDCIGEPLNSNLDRDSSAPRVPVDWLAKKRFELASEGVGEGVRGDATEPELRMFT